MKIKLTEPLIVCQITYDKGMEFTLTIDGERKLLSNKHLDIVVIGTEIKYDVIDGYEQGFVPFYSNVKLKI